MRWIGIFVGILLFVAGYVFLWEEELQPATELSSTEATKVYQLANGMKVIVQEDDRSDVVVSQVWYKVGASYEPEGKTGMSHVLEHMMFKGTDDYPAGEFSEIIALNGGRENAFTSKDYTAYFQSIASDRLELCLELEADRMQNLILDEAEFKKEVEVVKEERRLRTEDKPTALTYERFNAAAFESGPYHHPVIGWMHDLDKMSVSDMRDWYNKWYAPNNATLVVNGNVKAEQVISLANKYFGRIKAQKIPALKRDTAKPQQTSRYIEVALPAQVPYLLMGYKVPSLAQANTADLESDVYALEVLSGLLDGGNSTRLSKNLVRGREIASSAGAGYNPYDRLNTLFILSGLPSAKSNISELKAALFDEIEKLKKTLPEPIELERVKAQVIASNVYEKDSMFYQAMQLGILETTGLGWEKKDEYLEKISRVTPQQVQDVANKYFIDQTLTIAELKPLPMDNMKTPGSAAAGGRHGN
ncbi:MAG: insulinase family protein [Gammaproteobacteria bacterium]|nr:insulinase family protein [Gammaproteobacteria bacterium]